MSKEVKRYTLWMVSESGCELNPYQEPDADGNWVPAADYEALLAERDRLREVLNALRAATPSLTCESFHHARLDQHDHDEECPPFERWIAAALACNAALQGEQP